jgi:hypothetical protein
MWRWGRWLLVVGASTACAAQGVVRPAQWVEGETIASVGSGDCVVLASGRVRCAAERLDRLASRLVGVAKVSGGDGVLGYPRCAVTQDGRAACWGCATAPGQYLPPTFQSLTGVVQVVVGRARACALQRSGAVRCWGARFGELEHFDASICQAWPSERFEQAEPFPPVRQIAMTSDGRVCAVTATGAVLCDGIYEPVTDPMTIAASQPLIGALGPAPTPGVKPLSVPAARDIVAGAEHFCALGKDGSVTCWDENGHGQAGAPTELCVEYVYGGCKVEPTRVQLDSKATAIAAGEEHSCAVLEDGGVACWGNNEGGVLGFESEQVCHPNFRGFCNPVPERVAGIGDALQIAAMPDGRLNWVLTDEGALLRWPGGDRGPPDRRRPISRCRDHEGALTELQLARNAAQLLGKRVRARGVVGRPGRLGILHLQGDSALRVGDRVIVDGQLVRWHYGPDQPDSLGLYVYDACLTP